MRFLTVAYLQMLFMLSVSRKLVPKKNSLWLYHKGSENKHNQLQRGYRTTEIPVLTPVTRGYETLIPWDVRNRQVYDHPFDLTSAFQHYYRMPSFLPIKAGNRRYAHKYYGKLLPKKVSPDNPDRRRAEDYLFKHLFRGKHQDNMVKPRTTTPKMSYNAPTKNNADHSSVFNRPSQESSGTDSTLFVFGPTTVPTLTTNILRPLLPLISTTANLQAQSYETTTETTTTSEDDTYDSLDNLTDNAYYLEESQNSIDGASGEYPFNLHDLQYSTLDYEDAIQNAYTTPQNTIQLLHDIVNHFSQSLLDKSITERFDFDQDQSLTSKMKDDNHEKHLTYYTSVTPQINTLDITTQFHDNERDSKTDSNYVKNDCTPHIEVKLITTQHQQHVNDKTERISNHALSDSDKSYSKLFFDDTLATTEAMQYPYDTTQRVSDPFLLNYHQSTHIYSTPLLEEIGTTTEKQEYINDETEGISDRSLSNYNINYLTHNINEIVATTEKRHYVGDHTDNVFSNGASTSSDIFNMTQTQSNSLSFLTIPTNSYSWSTNSTETNTSIIQEINGDLKSLTSPDYQTEYNSESTGFTMFAKDGNPLSSHQTTDIISEKSELSGEGRYLPSNISKLWNVAKLSEINAYNLQNYNNDLDLEQTIEENIISNNTDESLYFSETVNPTVKENKMASNNFANNSTTKSFLITQTKAITSNEIEGVTPNKWYINQNISLLNENTYPNLEPKENNEINLIIYENNGGESKDIEIDTRGDKTKYLSNSFDFYTLPDNTYTTTSRIFIKPDFDITDMYMSKKKMINDEIEPKAEKDFILNEIDDVFSVTDLNPNVMVPTDINLLQSDNDTNSGYSTYPTFIRVTHQPYENKYPFERNHSPKNIYSTNNTLNGIMQVSDNTPFYVSRNETDSVTLEYNEPFAWSRENKDVLNEHLSNDTITLWYNLTDSFVNSINKKSELKPNEHSMETPPLLSAEYSTENNVDKSFATTSFTTQLKIFEDFGNDSNFLQYQTTKSPTHFDKLSFTDVKSLLTRANNHNHITPNILEINGKNVQKLPVEENTIIITSTTENFLIESRNIDSYNIDKDYQKVEKQQEKYLLNELNENEVTSEKISDFNILTSTLENVLDTKTSETAEKKVFLDNTRKHLNDQNITATLLVEYINSNDTTDKYQYDKQYTATEVNQIDASIGHDIFNPLNLNPNEFETTTTSLLEILTSIQDSGKHFYPESHIKEASGALLETTERNSTIKKHNLSTAEYARIDEKINEHNKVTTSRTALRHFWTTSNNEQRQRRSDISIAEDGADYYNYYDNLEGTIDSLQT